MWQSNKSNAGHVCSWAEVRRALHGAAYFGHPKSPVIPKAMWELSLGVWSVPSLKRSPIFLSFLVYRLISSHDVTWLKQASKIPNTFCKGTKILCLWSTIMTCPHKWILMYTHFNLKLNWKLLLSHYLKEINERYVGIHTYLVDFFSCCGTAIYTFFSRHCS